MSILGRRVTHHPAKKRKLSHSDEAIDGTFTKTPSLKPGTQEVSQASSSSQSGQDTNSRSLVELYPANCTLRAVSPSNTGSAIHKYPATQSTMLGLQVNELLSETRPNIERQSLKIQPIVDLVIEAVLEIPEVGPLHLVDAETSIRKGSGFAIPFSRPRPNKETKYTFEYRKPAKVTVVGSTLLGLNIKGPFVVDLAVKMPQSLFEAKDYLNYRAIHKRAYYLACLASGLQKKLGDGFILDYEYQGDIQTMPLLVLKAGEKDSKSTRQSKCTIRVMVGFPENVIPIEKTLPTKNCVRKSESESGTPLEPTPFYNSCIRSLSVVDLCQHFISQSIRECAAFRDSCLLGRIWLKQRGFGTSASGGGFGPFEWAMTCALLFRGGGPQRRPLLSSRYNSVQIVKAMLQFLAGRDLAKYPLVIGMGSPELRATSTPTLFDESVGLNFLFKMTASSYQMLRHEASLASAAINARNQNSFEWTFITNTVTPLLKFDEIFKIDVSTLTVEASFDFRAFAAELHQVLSRGLSDRAKLVNVQWSHYATWKPQSASPKMSHHPIVEVGLLANPEGAGRLVDHGPPIEEPAAAADFRKFWGNKSELRRFKDGSITESLVWSEDISVNVQIIQYLILYHFKLSFDTLSFCDGNLEAYITPGYTTSVNDVFQTVSSAYQSLSTNLHQLDGLPLSIRSIRPVDAQLSSSSLICPLIPTLASPVNILIQFEGSARWPDSLPAIQRTKIACLLKLADALTTSLPEINTRVGLENTSSATTGYLNTAYVDIILPSPHPGLSQIPFRLRIHHDRELHLLEKILQSKTLNGPARGLVSSAALTHKRTFVASFEHTSGIRALSTRFKSISPSIRLLKKWASSHLLLRHLPEEILELITAQAFLSPHPWSVPGSAQTGFLRALNILARWSWQTEPLIVDMHSTDNSHGSESSDNAITSSQLDAISTRFEAWRKLDPSMNNVVWFAASNLDPTGVIWTQGARPSRVVAARVQALASASVDLIKEKGTQMGAADWHSLFQSPLHDYDFLIHLKKSVIRAAQNVGGGSGKTKYKNLLVQEGLDVENIGYDPVKLFIEELEEKFGKSCLFFYDQDGGRVVAGLWDPSAVAARPHRVRMGWSTIPVAVDTEVVDGQGEDKGKAVINQPAMLAEMAMLGEGLVERVEIVSPGGS